MSILGPIPFAVFAWIAGGAMALAVGAYIIKMRRRRFEVPFSQLWQRVLEQKDANALWKQLKRLLSLLLILLIIAIMLFAALDPTLGVVDRKARSVVVLLDASASMKAMDGDERRRSSRGMDAAKARAKHLIDGMGGGDVAMIMKVDGQATPMSRFSSDAPMLDKIIDGIAASDTPADLTRALGAAADALRDRPNPLIVLVSDGAFPEPQLEPGAVERGRPAAPAPAAGTAPAAGAAAASWNTKNLAAVDLSGIDVRYLPVGRRSDNVGIIAFNVRRYIANKAAYEVYIEVQNFGQEPAHRQLTLYNGDTAVDVRRIDLAPGQRIRQIYAKLPASADDKLPRLAAPARRPRRLGSVRARRSGVRAVARPQEAEGPDGHARTTSSSRARCWSTRTSTCSTRSRPTSTPPGRRSPTAPTSWCSTTSRPRSCRRRRPRCCTSTRPARPARSPCAARSPARTSPSSTRATR